MNKKISIELSQEAALVLFDLLSRFSKEDELKAIDLAEKSVLWEMLNDLESLLAEPFAENYADILQEARQKILGPE